MKYLKKYESNTNSFKVTKDSIDEAIERSIDFSKRYYGNSIQFETIDDKYNKEFLEYCMNISYNCIKQEMKGFSRGETDKSYDYILDKSSDALKCGMKTIHNPISKIYEWEDWEDGYIQAFVRTSGDYFIWCIIKMDKLRDILEKFSGKLKYWYS